MGATLTERYEMKDKGTKRLTTDFERLRKDLKKVGLYFSVSFCNHDYYAKINIMFSLTLRLMKPHDLISLLISTSEIIISD